MVLPYAISTLLQNAANFITNYHRYYKKRLVLFFNVRLMRYYEMRQALSKITTSITQQNKFYFSFAVGALLQNTKCSLYTAATSFPGLFSAEDASPRRRKALGTRLIQLNLSQEATQSAKPRWSLTRGQITGVFTLNHHPVAESYEPILISMYKAPISAKYCEC